MHITAPHAVSTVEWFPPAAAWTTRHVTPHEHGALTHPLRFSSRPVGVAKAPAAPPVAGIVIGAPQLRRIDSLAARFASVLATSRSVAAANASRTSPAAARGFAGSFGAGLWCTGTSRGTR